MSMLRRDGAQGSCTCDLDLKLFNGDVRVHFTLLGIALEETIMFEGRNPSNLRSHINAKLIVNVDKTGPTAYLSPDEYCESYGWRTLWPVQTPKIQTKSR